MKCTTGKRKQELCAAGVDGVDGETLLARWEEIIPLLPADLDEQARQSGALTRRRGLRNATGLLQLVFAYVVGDWSLRQVCAWGLLSGVAAISDVAILNRLRRSVTWLSQLVAYRLREGLAGVAPAHRPAVRLRLVDATSLSAPGSQGTDWRVHLSLNVGEMRVDALTLTDVKGGEGFHHFPLAADEILVADRAYGYATSLSQVLCRQARCVVRIRWTDLAAYREQGQPFSVIVWLRRTFPTTALDAPGEMPGEAQAVELRLTTAQGSWPLRLVAAPLPAVERERAKVRLRRKAQKRQSQPSAESLLVAGFVLLVTNLPAAEWESAQVCSLYRLRWQVELSFKRLKSLIHLDHLRARDPHLAQAYLLGKLLVALLLDHLAHAFLAQVPTWAYDSHRPLSTWRLTSLLWQEMQMLFTHQLSHLLHFADPTRLRRYLCDSPRKRLQQATLARQFVRSLSVVNVQHPLC